MNFKIGARRSLMAASVAASREQWWGTPRHPDRMAVGDRVWLQVVGPKDSGAYYVAAIVSATNEHPFSQLTRAFPVADRHPVRLPHPRAAAEVGTARGRPARIVPANGPQAGQRFRSSPAAELASGEVCWNQGDAAGVQ
jgi:hypothetical protein